MVLATLLMMARFPPGRFAMSRSVGWALADVPVSVPGPLMMSRFSAGALRDVTVLAGPLMSRCSTGALRDVTVLVGPLVSRFPFWIP